MAKSEDVPESETSIFYRNKANIYYYNGLDLDLTIEEAEELFMSEINKAIELDPNDVENLKARSDYYSDFSDENEGYFQLAILDMFKVVELEPSYENYDALAFLYSYEGMYENALYVYIKYLNSLETLEKEKPLAILYCDIAEQYDFLNKTEEALKFYNLAVDNIGDESERTKSWIFLRRGKFLISKMKNFDSGYSDLERVVQLSPSYHRNRGDFFHELKEYEKAVEDYRVAITLGEDEYEGVYNDLFYELGINLSLSGEYDEAIRVLTRFSEGLDEDSSISSAYNDIAYIYQDGLNDYDKAREYYLMGVKKDSLNIGGYIGLGDLSLLKKEYDKSLMYYNKAIEIEPSSVNPYYARINFYIKNKKFDMALEDIFSARRLSPDDPDSYYKEAIVNNKLNKIKAIQNITTAIEKQVLSLKNDASGNEYYLYSGMSGYLQKRIFLEDLFLFRGEIFLKHNEKDEYCINLRLALNKTNSKDKAKNIGVLIEEYCE